MANLLWLGRTNATLARNVPTSEGAKGVVMNATQTAPRPHMTDAELEARAHARAYDQRVHIFSIPGRPGVYITRSKSDPRKRYSLVARDGIVACSCRGYEHRKV